MRSEYFNIDPKPLKLYRIVRDTPNGIVALSGEFVHLDNCKKRLEEYVDWVKGIREGEGWGLPYIMVETITCEKLKEEDK